MLVEIPTADEFMDNVVAFWRPRAPLRAGSEHRFDYRLVWTAALPLRRRGPASCRAAAGASTTCPAPAASSWTSRATPGVVARSLGQGGGADLTGVALSRCPKGAARG
jgi:periplasmic glucans biosynthesis protein